ncbi:MAG: hypothetical protein DHS20C21_23720 [Gemmatimonadota bacterium]|nr:MAG: hypothetical protein DHS20C21_23720 [Gemmatimonadota bacterium]
MRCPSCFLRSSVGFALGLAAGSALVPVSGASAADRLVGAGLAFPHVLPEHGESLELVGHIDPETAELPFPLNGDWNEYTWTLTGPVVYETLHPAPGIHYRRLTFGILELREDPSRNSAFLPNPPNVLVPSSFHDGSILLLGTVTDLEVRDIFGIVTATAELRFGGGTRVADLERTEWTFNAAISGFGAEVPLGYGARWTLDLHPSAPVTVQSDSWTAIKALYR